MSSTRTFEIKYRLKKGNTPTQTAIIQASDPMAARKIFEQQNPGCQIVSAPTEKKP